MDPGFAGAGRLILFGVLFTVAVAVVGPQDPGRTVANVPLRYMLPAIVFVLVLKGLFCEWVWRRNRWMGVVALTGLLLTNAAAWPLHIRNADTGASSAGYPLWNYVKFVTRLYPDPLKRASLWLAQNAGEDDNVYVAGKPDMENVTWYAGGRVRICCYIDAMSELPETTVAALPAPLRRGGGGGTRQTGSCSAHTTGRKARRWHYRPRRSSRVPGRRRQSSAAGRPSRPGPS